MPRIVIFSDQFLPTFPALEIPLFKELKNRGLDVSYILQEGDIRLTVPELVKIYGPIATSVIKPKHLLNLMAKDDILVSRFAYKGIAGDTATAIKNAKHRILMLDPAAIDIRVRECPAQYITVKSEHMKQEVLKKFHNYKQIFTTGTIHFDAAATTQVDRTEFMKSYGLNPNKKLALLTPANPAEGNHQKGVDNEYSQIAKIVKDKCPGYELMIKAHPMDYTAKLPAIPGVIHKHEYYKGHYSWEKFAPNAVVVKAEEGYKAIKACDVVLNVRSSIAMETPLFNKPLLNINRSKYTTNWPYLEGAMTDIKIEDLATILNTNSYSIDAEKCKKYISKYCFANDGKAYYRTADAIVKLLNKEV